MNNLVQVEDNHTFTTTLIIAEGVGIEHRAVMQLIKTHLADFKDLGGNTFQMSLLKGKNKPTKYYKLTELQSTFLITLMRNSKIVIKFKKELAKGFYKQQKLIQQLLSQQTNAQWLEQRDAGKISRRLETDEIKVFIDYATSQGSKNANRYYANISKMENKALFLVEQKYKNLRNVLGIIELSTVQQADIIVSKALKDGINNKLNYKDIYKLAKERVELFAELRGKSTLEYLSDKNNKAGEL